MVIGTVLFTVVVTALAVARPARPDRHRRAAVAGGGPPDPGRRPPRAAAGGDGPGCRGGRALRPTGATRRIPTASRPRAPACAPPCAAGGPTRPWHRRSGISWASTPAHGPRHGGGQPVARGPRRHHHPLLVLGGAADLRRRDRPRPVLGSFPQGPGGPDALGLAIDDLPTAVAVAAAFAVLFVVVACPLVVSAARLHARTAGRLLGRPADPLAPARAVLRSPGPLAPLAADGPAASPAARPHHLTLAPPVRT